MTQTPYSNIVFILACTGVESVHCVCLAFYVVEIWKGIKISKSNDMA